MTTLIIESALGEITRTEHFSPVSIPPKDILVPGHRNDQGLKFRPGSEIYDTRLK